MQLAVLTTLPNMFESMYLGVTGRAIKNMQVDVKIHNLREWGIGPHRQIDDTPYGGGPGMVMMVEPMLNAISSIKQSMPKDTKVVYLSPQGKRISQSDINQIVKNKQSILWIAGRYEGVDERIIDHIVDEEWSLGDFVLSGGELAAMVYIDAIVRLVPGVLGHQSSAVHDSFMQGLLDTPHYTKPYEHTLGTVPAVLASGNHKAIDTWRRKQMLGNTWLKRPDLLDSYPLSESDKQLLVEFKNEWSNTCQK